MLTQSIRLLAFTVTLFLNINSAAQAASSEGQLVVCADGSNVVLIVKKLPGQPILISEGLAGKYHQPKVVTSQQGQFKRLEFTRHTFNKQNCAEVIPTKNLIEQFGYYLDGCLGTAETESKLTLDLNLSAPRDSQLHYRARVKKIDLITKDLFSSYDKPYTHDSAVQCSISSLN